jgi:hypothetical protein
MLNNMVSLCGKTVDGLWVVTGTTLGFSTAGSLGTLGLFTTPALYTTLSNFCTQLLHNHFVLFSPVNQYLSAFSTAPTITITTYI